MYVYEMRYGNGVREDVCMRFKFKQFKSFLLMQPGSKVIVTDYQNEVVKVISSVEELNEFKTVHKLEDEIVIRQRYPKLLIVGHARHGKDTVTEILEGSYGFRTCASSSFSTERVIMPYFADVLGKPYGSVEECFADRVNHRALWYDLIGDYNTPDRTRLAREILKDHDAYCGMRHKREFLACRLAKLFDSVIWVDASDRLPPEDKNSCTIEPWMADTILDNNGTLEELHYTIGQLMKLFGISKKE